MENPTGVGAAHGVLLALSKCLCFTELQGSGCSEVFVELQCWAREAVVVSLDALSIFTFGTNDPADSMYRRCQPALFSSSSLVLLFSSFVGFSLGFALLP